MPNNCYHGVLANVTHSNMRVEYKPDFKSLQRNGAYGSGINTRLEKLIYMYEQPIYPNMRNFHFSLQYMITGQAVKDRQTDTDRRASNL